MPRLLTGPSPSSREKEDTDHRVSGCIGQCPPAFKETDGVEICRHVRESPEGGTSSRQIGSSQHRQYRQYRSILLGKVDGGPGYAVDNLGICRPYSYTCDDEADDDGDTLASNMAPLSRNVPFSRIFPFLAPVGLQTNLLPTSLSISCPSISSLAPQHYRESTVSGGLDRYDRPPDALASFGPLSV